MGWVKVRSSADGRASYTAMYRDVAGRERSAGTFARERQAVTAWHRVEEAMRTGAAGDPALARQSLRRYVEEMWFPNHLIEATTRESYRSALDLHILPDLGDRRIGELMPAHVREWVTALGERGVRPPTVRKAKQVLDAILTTAMNDRITALHAGRGVKTPPVPRRPRQIVTLDQYEQLRDAIGDPLMRLLVDTDIESGLRWGELTELRVRDMDAATGVLTVARAVVHLKADQPAGRFVVKDYPKDREARRVKIGPLLLEELLAHVAAQRLGADELLFSLPEPVTGRRARPRTDHPLEVGAGMAHGTVSAYNNAGCRCRSCRDAVADYRAARRSSGHDEPRRPRSVTGDGHIPNSWFRVQVWNPALRAADIGVRVTPHGLRHAHASWLLAGGADLQVVKERLGHASIATTGQYLHTLPGAGDTAIAALDAFRGRRPVAAVARFVTDPRERSSPSCGRWSVNLAGCWRGWLPASPRGATERGDRLRSSAKVVLRRYRPQRAKPGPSVGAVGGPITPLTCTAPSVRPSWPRNSLAWAYVRCVATADRELPVAPYGYWHAHGTRRD